MSGRSIMAVPRIIIFFIITSVFVQVNWRNTQSANQAHVASLSHSPGVLYLRLFSFGDPVTLAKVLMLWLQAFDNQLGASVPFKDLDYRKVQAWLGDILILDPRGNYPLQAASHLYARVPDEKKQRQMLEFIYQQYLIDPENRWPWLAHAVIVAQHRIKDLALALKYSQVLASNSLDDERIPYWVSQMNLIVLEEMGEFEAMQRSMASLLMSGKIVDLNEINFLNRWFSDLGRNK